MVKVNTNYTQLAENYLFADIAHRVAEYKKAHTEKKVISLGIGDVTRPLAPAVIEAMHKAVDDEAQTTTFHGYGSEQGYDFLREIIVRNDYKARGIDISADELFISDGAKSDTGNIVDLFDNDNSIGLTNPVYPVYMDSNVMSGHAGIQNGGRWSNIIMLPCTEQNGFAPDMPNKKVDLIYLCYPNNPTGTTLSKMQLTGWVNYALANGSIILFDAAYEAFITDDTPHSIYEIRGAKDCAIEFRSFSKTAGFTGVRLGYTIIPKSLVIPVSHNEKISLNHIWRRRQTTKFNGASYISQRGAEAVYSAEGRKQTEQAIQYYHRNADTMKHTLSDFGLTVFGGVNSPYLWVKIPKGETSWSFFDKLLNECAVVTTPGVGFGTCGEGYIRLTAFGNCEDVTEAMNRIKTIL